MFINGPNPTPRKIKLPFKAFQYPLIDCFALPQPAYDREKNYFDVVQRRQSVRTFRLLHLQEISNFLWLTAKVKTVSIAGNGLVVSRRPAPSAGGVHPIDVLFSLPAPIELRKLYYYDPFLHRLCELKLPEKQMSLFLAHVDACLSLGDGTLVWFVAHLERTLSHYAMPYSLVWRDAGALIYCAQINCVALGIQSCPIGTLAEPYLSEMFGHGKNIASAGGILLG